MKNFSTLILAALFSLTHSCLADTVATWPQWRGPTGMGIAEGSGYPTTWSENENIQWHTALPGRGWSSPLIQGNHVWLTTALETPASPETRAARLKENTGDQPLTLLEKVELRALCLDRTTGAILHDVLLLSVPDPQWVHQLNSYASPSPFIHGDHLYAHFGALGTACLHLPTAKVIWKNTELTVMHENGPGSSPIVWKDLLIFHMDGSDHQFIAALHLKDGSLAWKTPRSGKMHANAQQKKSYGTPLLVTIGQTEMLLSPASDWLYAYDATGRELWKHPYGILGFSLTPRPVLLGDVLYMSTGFMRAELLALKLLPQGPPQLLWKATKSVPTMPSPLAFKNCVYIVSDNGILTCLDASTGQEHYRERLGGEFSASPTMAAGHLYLGNRQGTTYVIAAGPEFRLIAKNELPGAIMASTAAIESTLYIRTETGLFAIAQGKKN